MSEARTAPKRRRLSDEERGFRLGIGVACGVIVNGFDQPRIAAELLGASGMTVAKARAVDMCDYDLKAVRIAARQP